MKNNPVKIRGLDAELSYMDRNITIQDVKRWTAYAVLSGGILTSVYWFGMYSTKPDLRNELSVLQGTSAYLKSYEGNDPTKAFIYTKFSLDVAKNNPKVKGLKSLEDEVAKIEGDIKTSTNKFVFKPVLNYISTRIDDVVNYNKYNNSKNISDLFFGAFFGVASATAGILFLANGIFDKKK